MENVILRNELLRWSGCCPRARETTLLSRCSGLAQQMHVMLYFFCSRHKGCMCTGRKPDHCAGSASFILGPEDF